MSCLVLALAFGLWYDGWWSGFAIGVGLSAAIAIPSYLLLLLSGAAPKMMGAGAEEWTAQELATVVRHRGRVFDHVNVGRGDVDHVVLTPTRALAVETKWSATPWRSNRYSEQVVSEAAGQVARGARSLGNLLKSTNVAMPRQVERLVVVWGRHDQPPPESWMVDGCVVVPGRSLGAWISAWLSSEAEEPDKRFAEGCDRLERFIKMRDEFNEQHAPATFIERHGVLAPLGSIGEGLIGCVFGVVLAGTVMSWIDRGWTGIVTGIGVSGLVGCALLRHRQAAALGWLIGLGAVAVSILAVTAYLLLE